jgi:hypothetical protein
MARGVKGVVLEAFGVGNMPDSVSQGWLPWLRWAAGCRDRWEAADHALFAT